MKKSLILLGLPLFLAAACSGSNGQGSGNQGAANVAPRIAGIPDQSISANIQSMEIPFSVNDEAVSQLSFEVLSDNPDLVPADAFAVSGNANPFALTATPVIDSLGDTLVTIIVTDAAGLSDSVAFILTVAPQQLSLQQFTRATFAAGPGSDAERINAVEFTNDAEGDDFADLLAE
jgi:hypothetical protein